ncbi:hypothetical protein [uncultured Gilliamella sp.]|uniref:hypothetical protein n=1 Tax=uncultured Gilliamella sp. TaxID=1193505 RepID=UPI0025F6881C|nr:hypothetical protein [uncultured Gilliamella sp.]
MSLEQAIIENTAVLVSIRELLLSRNTPASPENEVTNNAPPKPTKKTQSVMVEDKPETAPTKSANIPTTTTTEPTEQEVIKSFVELAKIKREAAVVVLAQFKAAKAVDVPKNQWRDFLKAIKDKLAEISEV